MTIRMGMIGASQGNGHPYSWSAIFNGYNAAELENCGYPSIPEYLNKQIWPDSRLDAAKVNTVWTQDRVLSEHIAKSTYIEHVSSSLEELGERSDAVLLARDDAENHIEIARQFLLAGKPIYIDKPIALTMHNLRKLYDLQQYDGQIFTCSALRYSPELCLTVADQKLLGEIKLISASTPKSWNKYGVHIIEPVLNMLSIDDEPIKYERFTESDAVTTLSVEWRSGIKTVFAALGSVQSTIRIQVEGTQGSKELIFSDSFTAFKMALQDFVDGIVHNECRSPFEFNAKVVSLIERGAG